MVLQSQMLVVFRQSKSLLRRLYSFDQSLKVHLKQIITLTIVPVLHVDMESLACYSERFNMLSEAEIGVLDPPGNTCSLDYHQQGVNRFRVGVYRMFS